MSADNYFSDFVFIFIFCWGGGGGGPDFVVLFLLFLMMFKDMATVSPHNLLYKIGSDMRFDFLNILWSVFESIISRKLSDLFFFSRFSC